jgi:fatty acid desaturase
MRQSPGGIPTGTLFIAATYFFVSSYWQSVPIRSFIAKAQEKNGPLYRRIVFQYVFFATTHIALACLAIALYGLKAGLFLYSMAFLLPAFFALWTIMLFNYEQHVHTDPWSDFNHSRNWDGRLLNFLLFNNGLHAAHHETPGTHWSKLRPVHEQLAPHIDPRLVHRSMWGYFFRQYVIALFFPAFGTQQMGRAPFDPPDGRPASLQTAEVDLGDAGVTADMIRG